MPENSKISAKLKRVLLFSIFVIPTVICFAFYIFMIRKPFLENPSGLYIKLNYYGSKHLAANGKDTVYASLPDFSFINQDGQSFNQTRMDGKITVIAFMCSSCSTSCPKLAANFFRMQKKLSYLKAFSIMALSVHPETESPLVLKEYARLVHADPNYWNFLTGNKESLFELAQKGFEFNLSDSASTIEHQATIYLIDKKRHIRGLYDGTSTTDTDRLIDEIKVLDAEYRVAKRAS